jgi:von Willebrand factor type A domain
METEKKELNITENINKATEVAFSFDTTGSMYPCLAAVRQCVEKTVEEMFELIPNLKVGLICHGDYCDGDNCYKVLPLTDDKTKIYNFIRNAPATSGGDIEECYELALNLAKTLGWSDNKGGKILVLIGDAPPHEPNYMYNTDKLDWRKELQDLKESGIDVYPLQCLYSERSAGNEFWSAIAEAHGTPLLKLEDMNDAGLALTGMACASSGSAAFGAYETKNAVGLCSMAPASVVAYTARNAVLRKVAEKYDEK